MGNQESTRRVSFENDEPDNVVKVSEKVVVELLKQSTEGDSSQQQRQNKQSNTEPQQRSGVQSKLGDEPLVCYGGAEPKTQAGKYSNTEKIIPENVAGDPELNVKLENELQKNNEYWEGRIKALQESHDRINKTWETEYKKAFDDVDYLFGKIPPKDGATPCSAEKSAVLDCYKKNADQPLMCSDVVQAFSDCMNGAKK